VITLTLLLAAVLVGCVNVATHQAVDRGVTEQEGYSKSEDSQASSDISNEVASRISGIDKSNQEITKNLDKQSKMLKQTRDRDYEKDKLDPAIPREHREKLYKRDQ